MKAKVLILSTFMLLCLASCVNENPSSENSIANENSSITSQTSETSSSISDSEVSSSVSVSSQLGQKIDVSNALNKAKNAIHFTGTYYSFYPSDQSLNEEASLDFTIANDFYQAKRKYKDSASREFNDEYIFVKGQDGKVYNKTLSILNAESSELYIYESVDGDISFNYDEFCKNPFNELSSDDFYKDEFGVYLNPNAVQAFNNLVVFESIKSSQFYKDTVVESVSFVYNEEKLQFDSLTIQTVLQSDNHYSPDDFMFTFELSLDYPENVTCPTVEVMPHTAEHDVLKTALEDMQSKIALHNYTVSAREVDSTGEFDVTYDTYYVEDGAFSDFHPALENYKFGYKLQDDNKYHRYKYYLSGTEEGQYEYDEKSTIKTLSREELDLSLTSFAPEFFKSNGQNKFITTNKAVVAEIRKAICPFIDRYDLFYIGTKVWVTLDDQNKITEIGCTAYDWSNEYTDDFTYTIHSFGTTVLPITLDKPLTK